MGSEMCIRDRACPTPAQLPHGSQFAAAVDLPGIVAGYPPPSVTAAAAPPSIIGIRGVAAYTSSVEDQERQPSSTAVERPQLLDVDYAAEGRHHRIRTIVDDASTVRQRHLRSNLLTAVVTFVNRRHQLSLPVDLRVAVPHRLTTRRFQLRVPTSA